MKRSSILTLTAALLLAVSLTACGGTGADNIVGDWSAVLSVGDQLTEAMAADESLGQYFADTSFADMEVTLLASFNEDGTYTIATDEESLAASMERIREPLETALRGYLEDMVAEMGLEMSVDELMEVSGMSVDDLLDQIDLGKMTAALDNSGTYALEEGRLSLDGGASYEISLEKNKLTLLSADGETDDSFQNLYPIVFERVS